MSSGGDVNLGDLQVFDAFRFMLSEAQQKQHAECVQASFATKSLATGSASSAGRAIVLARVGSAASYSAVKVEKKKKAATSTTLDLLRRSRAARA